MYVSITAWFGHPDTTSNGDLPETEGWDNCFCSSPQSHSFSFSTNRTSLFQTQTNHPIGARGRAMDGSTTDYIRYLFWWVRWEPFQAAADHTEWWLGVLGQKAHLRGPMSGQQGWGTWHQFPLFNVIVVSNDLPFFSSFLWRATPFSGPQVRDLSLWNP